MNDHLDRSFDEASALLDWLRTDASARANVAGMIEDMAACLRAGGRLLSCGNGGSMCDAMHFAEELSGRFRDDRPALSALALSDPGHLTCVANDYGFEQVFARGVQAHGRTGDVLLGFTTSGKSPNVLAAAREARARGMKVFGLLGKGGGPVLELCDRAVVVPSSSTDRIQEIHIKVVHILIEGVERELFPDNYA
jgi:D-sedoheptulose 7-phosphate isomerase